MDIWKDVGIDRWKDKRRDREMDGEMEGQRDDTVMERQLEQTQAET